MFLARAYLCTTCLQCPCKPEEGVGSPGTGGPDAYELLCRSWELNTGPLGEQPVLVTTEPSLQPKQSCFCNEIIYSPFQNTAAYKASLAINCKETIQSSAGIKSAGTSILQSPFIPHQLLTLDANPQKEQNAPICMFLGQVLTTSDGSF